MGGVGVGGLGGVGVVGVWVVFFFCFFVFFFMQSSFGLPSRLPHCVILESPVVAIGLQSLALAAPQQRELQAQVMVEFKAIFESLPLRLSTQRLHAIFIHRRG